MTTLQRFAVLGASQAAADATRGILYDDAAYAAEVARTLTRRHVTPVMQTDALLDGPCRVATCTIEVVDARTDQPDGD